jgi:hypothetical protein
VYPGAQDGGSGVAAGVAIGDATVGGSVAAGGGAGSAVGAAGAWNEERATCGPPSCGS